MDPLPIASVAPSPEQVRRATEEVLGRTEFYPGKGSADQVMEAIRRALASIGEWAARHPVAAWFLILLLVLVLIGLLLHIGYTFYRAVLRPVDVQTKRRDVARSSWEILEGAARDWGSALVKAKEALARGDERRAVWIGHRVLLGLLDERGALEFSAWKTNADYLAECPSTQPVATTLGELTRVYDEVVYGHRRVDTDAIGRLLDRVGQTRTEASS